MAKKLAGIHPGEILKAEFLEPMGISNTRLASDIDVPPSRISEIVNGLRPVTRDTAARLAIYFGTDVRFWINLQAEYDARVAMQELMPQIRPRIRSMEIQ